MEGMDDSASLKDLNEIEDDEKSVKSCDDKNVKNVVVVEDVESDSKVVESSSRIGDDFDPKIDQLTEPAKFAPKDLLALLRKIEKEIHQVQHHF